MTPNTNGEGPKDGPVNPDGGSGDGLSGRPTAQSGGRDTVHAPRYEAQRVNPLHMIHKWSIEHPYAVIAFYVAVLALAWMTISGVISRRFAPYVQSPMIGVVTMMPGLSAQEMELYISKPIE